MQRLGAHDLRIRVASHDERDEAVAAHQCLEPLGIAGVGGTQFAVGKDDDHVHVSLLGRAVDLLRDRELELGEFAVRDDRARDLLSGCRAGDKQRCASNASAAIGACARSGGGWVRYPAGIPTAPG